MTLFQLGKFTLSSGQKSDIKIECDSLTLDDWEGLGYLAWKILYCNFSKIIGVPTGGEKFANSLNKYRSPIGPVLICDDVLTTGRSMQKYKEIYPDAIGIVAFSRTQKLESWIKVIWTYTDEKKQKLKEVKKEL